MQYLLDYASYMPHGYCLFWQPWLVLLFAGSDLLIFLSYSAIPVALWLFLVRRPDIRYRSLIALFSAFILLCGLAHLVSIITLWIPVYPLHGLIKMITGVVSAITAGVLFWLVPSLVAIPSPHQLAEVNARLRREIDAHERTLADLREAQLTLEAKVDERTAALVEANDTLAVMTREAVHRVQNLLAVVASIARQTGRTAPDIASFLTTFTGRIDALAVASATVAQGSGDGTAQLDAVAQRQLAPVLLTYGDRLRIAGPAVEVGAEAAQQLALALHELATNAQKHGAFRSAPQNAATDPGEPGQVDLTWSIAGAKENRKLTLEWRETVSPGDAGVAARATKADGFGRVLLNNVVPAMLDGVAEQEEGPTGQTYRLIVPVSVLTPKTPAGEKPQQVDTVWASAWMPGEQPA